MDKWVSDRLTECLGFPVPDEMINFVITLKEQQKIDNYFETLLDPTIEQHRNFLQEFKNRVCTKKNTNKNNNNKTKRSDNRNSFPLKDQKLAVQTETKSFEATGAKKKSKYTNLYDQDGKMNDVVLLKGRHKCNCQAAKHKLINNCLRCGRIICEQEGSGPCLFCGHLVCTEEELRLIDSSSKKGDSLKRSLMQQERPKGWEEAVAMRNRLLEYDRTSEKRTTVIDDEFDYFKTNSVWLSDAEREKLNKLEKQMHEKRHSSSRLKKITIDFSGREIIEEPQFPKQMEEEILREIAVASDSFKEIKIISDRIDGDHDVHPILLAPPPIFDEAFVHNAANRQATRPRYDGVYNRVQDKELLEVSDLKKCISMHQPWASLLISGIKKHEGRCWYSSHRGRLWIASTAKLPDSDTILAMEDFYRHHYNDKSIEFPKQYPSGCLLGCVIVKDVLPQEEYRKQYPDGESDSPFVFVCAEPEELPVRFPLSGSHKIYDLEDHIHIAAVKSLQRLAKLRADESKENNM